MRCLRCTCGERRVTLYASNFQLNYYLYCSDCKKQLGVDHYVEYNDLLNGKYREKLKTELVARWKKMVAEAKPKE